MASLIDFREQIILHAAGCPDFVIEAAVLRAARAYCKDTRIWQDQPGDEETLTIDEHETDTVYTLSLPDYVPADPGPPEVPEVQSVRAIIGISNVICNDYAMVPGDEYAKDIQDAKIVFATAPTLSDVIKVKRVYQPAKDAPTLPDFLLEDHEEAIASKAVSELLMMPGKPWSNPAAVGDFRARYNGLVDETIAKAMKGGTSKSLSAKAKEFGFTGADNQMLYDPTLQFDV